MIEKEAREKLLQQVMADMGPESPFALTRAEFTMRVHARDLGECTYDELIALANQSDTFMKSVGVFDPAYERFISERNATLKMADAVNTVKQLGRHDHEMKVHGIVEVNGVSAECEFYIPRLYYHTSRRDQIIRDAIRNKTTLVAELRGSRRHMDVIDFVEL